MSTCCCTAVSCISSRSRIPRGVANSIAPLSVFFALGAGAVDAWLEARGAHWARVLAGAWLASFAAVLWLSYLG